MDLCRTCLQSGFCTFPYRLMRPVQVCPLYLGESAAGYVNEWMDFSRPHDRRPRDEDTQMATMPRGASRGQPGGFPKLKRARP